jgi:hypothetical protein
MGLDGLAVMDFYRPQPTGLLMTMDMELLPGPGCKSGPGKELNGLDERSEAGTPRFRSGAPR